MEKEYRVLSFSEGRELGINELYSCLVGPDEFECTLTEIEDRTWGRDLRPVVNRLKEQHARIRELEAEISERRLDYTEDCKRLDAAINDFEHQLATEKKRREYYQHIVYSVCNMLDQIDGRHHCIVCGTAEEPCNNVEAKIQQLTTELDSLRQQLAAAQEREVAYRNALMDAAARIVGLESALMDYQRRVKELEYGIEIGAKEWYENRCRRHEEDKKIAAKIRNLEAQLAAAQEREVAYRNALMDAAKDFDQAGMGNCCQRVLDELNRIINAAEADHANN